MKFVRFVSAGFPQGTYGVFADDSHIEVIAGGLFDPIEKTGKVVDESEITRYLPPVNPPNLLAIGLNYVEHSKETQQKLPTEPLLFIKATTTVVGHGDDIVLPHVAPNGVDYEAELCAIIGRTAKNVSEEEALDYVFGYTCGNDVSDRDVQFKDGQWARGKSFDTFAPLGPYVVTDYDPSSRRVISRLNGKVMQDGITSDMVFPVHKLVSYLSHCMTLPPGTIIMTGTPSGVGYTRTPPVYLKPGDISEVEVEGLGILRNKVVAE
ncbi:MAG: fumarylacetoacetate hydrolase family protein [Armatimonadetes bacterium]|nr:fumarylacetoacetate hydrolase family protein [Armatimonadota bacterium]